MTADHLTPEQPPMTRAELRLFFEGWFCGCGCPASAAELVRDLLVAFDRSGCEREEWAAKWQQALDLLPDDRVRYLVLYTLDSRGLLEHGTSVDGSWLTDEGHRVLAALRSHDLDALFDDDSDAMLDALSALYKVQWAKEEAKAWPQTALALLNAAAESLAHDACERERDALKDLVERARAEVAGVVVL